MYQLTIYHRSGTIVDQIICKTVEECNYEAYRKYDSRSLKNGGWFFWDVPRYIEFGPYCPKCGSLGIIFDDGVERHQVIFGVNKNIEYRPYKGSANPHNLIDFGIYCMFCNFYEEALTPEELIEEYPECKKEMV